ncbi:MAG: DNA primase [Pirellulales bacterium]|nr:DNA primase [Pirellulales bacterium]
MVSLGSLSEAKELVRQAIDIVDLVGRHIQLRRQGRHYVGLCPWHDDTRPSLQVNPERQSFKCWVCDIGGDIFTFVEKIEGVAFPEALAMLAEQAGVQLKPRDPGSAPTGGDSDKRILYQAMAWAESQYQECLMRQPEGDVARRYLSGRGIPSETARKFHLGYSPAWDWILQRARGTQYTPAILEKIGILARSADGHGKPYDRFRGRVLFSIRDAQGRPVGLGGRVLPESGVSSPAKYVNSPETPLFTKSRLLYGLDMARDAMRKSRTALVMEGYTDCILAHQHGFEDAVAVLGTALGEQHIRVLNHFADRIVLVLDGDEAGQKRAAEVLELFVAQKIDLRIVTLPEGLDPCDFLAKYGSDAFRHILNDGAVDALEHAFQVETRGVDLKRDIHGATEALERLVAIVAKGPRLRADSTPEDRFREEKVLQRLAASFRVPEQDVRGRLTALRRAGQRRAALPVGKASERPESKQPSDPAAWQRLLLEILLQFPEYVVTAQAEIDPSELAFEPCRRIFGKCCELTDAGAVPTFDRLMLEFDEPAVKSLLVELDETGRAKQLASPLELLEAFFQTFRRRKVVQQTPGQIEEESLFRMARELQARHGISSPTEG